MYYLFAYLVPALSYAPRVPMKNFFFVESMLVHFLNAEECMLLAICKPKTKGGLGIRLIELKIGTGQECVSCSGFWHLGILLSGQTG